MKEGKGRREVGRVEGASTDEGSMTDVENGLRHAISRLTNYTNP